MLPTTDGGHYLTDSSAGTASEIFNVASNSYTDGTQFDFRRTPMLKMVLRQSEKKLRNR